MPLLRKIAALLAAVLTLQGAPFSCAQQPSDVLQSQARIQVTTELVLVNVVARDKQGNLVRELKKEDFTLFEDGKKQDIIRFDFESVDQAPLGSSATVTGAAGQTPGTLLRSSKKSPPSLDARDRRLILLFFDFSAME